MTESYHLTLLRAPPPHFANTQSYLLRCTVLHVFNGGGPRDGPAPFTPRGEMSVSLDVQILHHDEQRELSLSLSIRITSTSEAMVLCEGTTRAGAQCKNKAKYDGRWCHHHQNVSGSAPRPPGFPTVAKRWPKSPNPTGNAAILDANHYTSEHPSPMPSMDESDSSDTLFVRPWSQRRRRSKKSDSGTPGIPSPPPRSSIQQQGAARFVDCKQKQCPAGPATRTASTWTSCDSNNAGYSALCSDPRGVSASIVDQLEAMCSAVCSSSSGGGFSATPPGFGHNDDPVLVGALIDVQRRAAVRAVFEFGEMLAMLREHRQGSEDEEL
ncbi:hypothetical protein IWX90DRAFT_419252 [Phyllosticta citrichinensis]|uniref:Uncharacterized protein n=1 Tax=Phyllosticta citrichinensis TaxID=1130410 RepID=A0ABR1XFG1_9PEZI